MPWDLLCQGPAGPASRRRVSQSLADSQDHQIAALGSPRRHGPCLHLVPEAIL